MIEENKITSQESLESKIGSDKAPSAKKVALVDTAGNISYSLIAGSILDYCAGLNLSP